MLLARLCQTLVRDGAITLMDAGGATYRLGRSSRGTDLVVRLHDPGLHHRIALGPCRALGDAYVDGTLTVERGDVYDLFDLYARNVDRLGAHPDAGLLEQAMSGARRLAARIELEFGSKLKVRIIPLFANELGSARPD